MVAPVYGSVASKFSRIGPMASVRLLFNANLAALCVLGGAGVKVGIEFYIWLGIFNMLAVS